VLPASKSPSPTHSKSTKAGSIDDGDLLTGDFVSVNQLESLAPGMVPLRKGKLLKAKYHAALLYCNHATRKLFLKCHFSTGPEEAI
jgi:hypothetical protein